MSSRPPIIDIPPQTMIQALEFPELDSKYAKAHRDFVIWLAPTAAGIVFACIIMSYFSTLETPHAVYTLPAFLAFCFGLLIALSVIWTYLQRRNVLDMQLYQHVEDRKAGRELAENSMKVTLTLTQNNIGNLNQGQQNVLSTLFTPPQEDNEETQMKVTRGGKTLRDFWNFSPNEPAKLPPPKSEGFIIPWGDVDGLVDLMFEYGAARRDTIGKPLPSKTPVYAQTWSAVVNAMHTVSAAEVRDKVPTKLLVQDPVKVKADLRAGFPDGIVAEPQSQKKAGRGRKSSPKSTSTSSASNAIVDG